MVGFLTTANDLPASIDNAARRFIQGSAPMMGTLMGGRLLWIRPTDHRASDQRTPDVSAGTPPLRVREKSSFHVREKPLFRVREKPLFRVREKSPFRVREKSPFMFGRSLRSMS